MSNDNFGGPAFPVKLQNDTGRQITGFMAEEIQVGVTANYSGMTLRDYFAAKAMQGMLAYPGDDQRGSHHNNNDAEGVAQMSYAYADAMLAERAK